MKPLQIFRSTIKSSQSNMSRAFFRLITILLVFSFLLTPFTSVLAKKATRSLPTFRIESPSVKFKKDNSLSQKEQLAKVRQHILKNKLPQTALNRLDAFEMQQKKIPKRKSLPTRAFNFITGNTDKAKEKKKAIEFAKKSPFKVETFKGEINTAPEKDYNGGIFSAAAEGGALMEPSGYLAEGGEITFSQAIKDQANVLNKDPLTMLNFVRNEVKYIPYYGSKKGADATLVEFVGNDTDKASLLIAMLRYSNIPARYRRVDAKMSIRTITDLLGVDSPMAAARILSLGKIPYTLYTQNGDPLYFVLEHTYVEAYMPYGYSRGIDVNDGGTSQWVPMDPTINAYYYEQLVDIMGEMNKKGFDVKVFFDNYLNGNYNTLEPLEAFKSEVKTYLPNITPEYYPNLTYEEALTRFYPRIQNLEFIPGSLPFEISADLNTYDYIPASLRHTIKFTVKDKDNNIALNHTAYVSDLADKELLVTYNAATSGDQTIIDTFDTIYDVVPLSLVNVKPIIKINGNVVATGTTATTLGQIQEYTMDFSIPTRVLGGVITTSIAETMDESTITGTTNAIAFNTDRVIPPELRRVADTASNSFMSDQMLYRTALDYLDRLQYTQGELADIIGSNFTNTATVAVISNGIKVTNSNGEPYSFEWKGLRIDSSANVRYFNRFNEDTNTYRPEFLALLTLQASQDESDIFEDNFNVESVATVKGLKLVSKGQFPGVTMKKITSANESDIDSLDVSSSTKTIFRTAIADGKTIYTPTKAVTYGNWQGLFYITTNFDDEMSYRIGEGLNGGYSVEQWPSGWQNFWRTHLLPGLTAVITSPRNGDSFIKGKEDIHFSAHYTSPLQSWVENIFVSTKNRPVGPLVLKSGYGTNARVAVNIQENQLMKIGDIYNRYDSLIIQYENEFEIPRGLLKSIIHKETERDPFKEKQYRYEPAVDYDNFSGSSPAHPISSSHPYKRFAIAGHTSTNVNILKGDQLDSLDPKFTDVIKSRGTGGWALRGIKGYLEGQTFTQLQDNDTAPGTQAWLTSARSDHSIQSLSNRNFTAQVVLSASYGMGHVLYLSAITIAKDMNGNIWFDKSTSGNAVSVFDMNNTDIATRLAASVLRFKYDNIPSVPADSGKCDGWAHAIRAYNGSGTKANEYRDDVCSRFYTNMYKP